MKRLHVLNIKEADERPRRFSNGVGVDEVVPRPARAGNRRVLMEEGFKMDVRKPPKKLGMLVRCEGK